MSTAIDWIQVNAGLLTLVVACVTLLVAVVASTVGLLQLRDAKRGLGLNAVATTVGLYSISKARFYDLLLANAFLFEGRVDKETASLDSR